MKDRIFKIMKQEGLNQKDFAATTGISPATLSSIFNGRTSPTLNHAEALHRRFPRLNMSWLLFGEGDMYIKDAATDKGTQTGDSLDFSTDTDMQSSVQSPDMFSDDSVAYPAFDADGNTLRAPMVREVVKYIDKPKRRITEIRIFFDDGTFETFMGPGR